MMRKQVFVLACCLTLCLILSEINGKHGKKGKGKRKGNKSSVYTPHGEKGKGKRKGKEPSVYTPYGKNEKKMCKLDTSRDLPQYERVFIYLPIVSLSLEIHKKPWPENWYWYNSEIGFDTPDKIIRAGRTALELFKRHFGLEGLDAVTDDQLANGKNIKFDNFTVNAVTHDAYTNNIETLGKKVNYYTNAPPVYTGGWFLEMKGDHYIKGEGFEGIVGDGSFIEWGHYFIDSGKYCGLEDKVKIHFETRVPSEASKGVKFDKFLMRHDKYGDGMALGVWGKEYRDSKTYHTVVAIKFPAYT